MLVLVLAVLSSVELIYALTNLSDVNPVDYYTPLIKLITFCYASVLISLNRKKAISSSGIFFLFWFFLSVGSIATYRSIITNLLEPNSKNWILEPLNYTLKIVGIPLVFAEWVLSCFSDSLPHSYTLPGQDINNPSPEWNASFITHLTWWWVNPLILIGYRKPLQLEDMYDLSTENTASYGSERFKKYWSYEKHPEIFWPLVRGFWKSLLMAASFKLVAALLTFVPPTILDYLLIWMASPDAPAWRGYFYAGIMFTSSFVESMFSNQYEYAIQLTAMRMRAALIDTLHQKALKLSPTAKTEFTTGEIVNLMSVDTQRIVDYLSFVNWWWIAPIQIGFSLYLLWAQLGIATLAGMAIMIILIPLNAWITSKWRSTQATLMKEKDKRTKLMNEVLNGMKVLKLYGWEPSFTTQIKGIREREMKELRTQSYYASVVTFTLSCAPIFVALFSFLTFTLTDDKNILDASKAFVSLSVFNIMRIPLAMLPMLITFGAMVSISDTHVFCIIIF